MKNEMAGAKKVEGKAGLSAATLPWWAKVLIAQHLKTFCTESSSHHVHQYGSKVCPEDIAKIQPLKEGPNMKTLIDPTVVNLDEGGEVAWDAEGRESGPSLGALSAWTKVMVAKVCAVVRSERKTPYACARCRAIVYRNTPDLVKHSVLCLSCNSEIYLKSLSKNKFPYACAQ